MEQHINKVNATTRDYRGNKSVLNQRVIEGVSQTIYDLSTDLQLEESTPKTIIINNVENGSIFLPNAKTLLSGWKITIINESTIKDCNIYYYNTSTLFASVAKNRMIEILFLGKENNEDEQGKWKVVILSENIVNDTDIYTTDIYSTTKLRYNDLGSSFTYNKLLIKLEKNKPIKSIYVKTNEQFSGANVNLNIGLIDNLSYFYENLDLTQDLTQRDLFNEIVDPNNAQYIIGNFFIPNVSTNSWTSITSNISDKITCAYFNDGKYILQANDTLYFTSSLSSNITFSTKSISDFGFDSYSEYSLQFESSTQTYYFFGVKNNRLCYTASTDNGVSWASTLIINEEFEIDDIKYITKIYNEDNHKWFISATVDNNAHIIYIDDIGLPSSWSLFPLKYNDTFIEDINNITCDFSHLIINTDTATYYSINNGYSLNLLESYNSVIYKIKYINNIWIRFPYNDVDGYSFKYAFEFNTNINSWTEKQLPDNVINDNTMHVNYILDFNYTDGIWSIFRNYQPLDNPQHFDLFLSTDLFNTMTPIDTTSFNGDKLTCICGNGSSGYLVTGDNGKLSYSSVNSSFIDLNAGEVEIIIEYVDSVNPINLLNPIIQGQIMPLGTVIHYPFARTIPAGYVRLDGTKIKNVKNDFPEFYDLLQKNPQMILGGNSPQIKSDGGFDGSYYEITLDTGNTSAWKQLVQNSEGNYPKFVWVNNTDIRTPVINCFVRGFTGDMFSDFAQYYQDGVPNITGSLPNGNERNNWNPTGAFYKLSSTNTTAYNGTANPNSIGFDASRSNLVYGRANEVRPKNITYPYIMAYYHTVQNTGTYNLQTMGELLDKLDADIILAKNTINDLTRKVPAGTIAPYAGNTLPDGWLWCNGTSYFRSTYNELFDKIGTIYGDDGGNPEKFNVPKIDDNRFIEGVNNNENNKKNAGLPNITGTLHWWYTGGLDQVDGAFAADSYRHADGGGGGGHNSIGVTFNASRSSSIYGNSSTVQPKAIRLRYIIKY